MSIWLVIFLVWLVGLLCFYAGFRYGRAIGIMIGSSFAADEQKENP